MNGAHTTVFGPEIEERFTQYAAELARWNRAHNLVGPRELARFRERHLAEALLAVPLVHGNDLIDVGTGAGLPGMPIAIARPDVAVTLLDANGRKTRFLHHVATTLGLDNVTVVQGRLEDHRPRTAPATVTTRALAPPERLAQLLAPLCDAHTRVLWYAGVADADECLAGFRECSRQALPSGAGLLVTLQRQHPAGA